MNTGPQKNAVERRLHYLEGLWNDFAQSQDYQILRWLTDGDEETMVKLFIQIQNESMGSTPDLFIPLSTPFKGSGYYGSYLAREIIRYHDESREAIIEIGFPEIWQPPDMNNSLQDVEVLRDLCISFLHCYGNLFENLVLFLSPSHISDLDGFQTWILNFLQSNPPLRLRLTVVDDISSPQLELLSGEGQKLIMTVSPELQMADAWEEMAEQPTRNGPDYIFRRHFVALLNAAAKGDDIAMNKAAVSALKVTDALKWPHLSTAVHLAVGTACLNGQKIGKAIEKYRAARQSAQDAAQIGQPAAAKLTIQSWFAEGAALVSTGEFKEAARVYEIVAPLAEKEGDVLMTMEGWRMAAYCHEQYDALEDAGRCGDLALDAAEQMDEEMRLNTTLVYAGQGLLRVVQKGQGDDERADLIHQRMARLVGHDWQNKFEKGG